eukprot:3460990-Amphidinium_carterae.1
MANDVAIPGTQPSKCPPHTQNKNPWDAVADKCDLALSILTKNSSNYHPTAIHYRINSPNPKT